jgi:pimeloyl-ACP methyl ester carboxylesterase
MIFKRFWAISAICFFVLASPVFAAACYKGACVADSEDKTPISYSVYGKGEVTLVFIHGWSCDSRYWREQTPVFSRKYQVVTIDLAGHGNSGSMRHDYTRQAFARDVKAVIDAIGARRVILIGHSMGGTIAAGAAVLMPDRVIGIIPVDTIQNVEPTMTRAQIDEMFGPFSVDFRSAAVAFAKSMFVDGADPKLVDWVAADMSSAPPQVGMSIFDDMFNDYLRGGEAKLLEEVKVPVRCINARLWPTDEAANRRHIQSYSVVYMEDVGHFLMLEKPKEFNKLLDEAIRNICDSDALSNHK